MGSTMVQWSGCVGDNARSAHPDCVEINHLQVRVQFRGRGVGTALITAAEELARARGVAEIGLGVSAANSGAVKLYRRLGFEPTGIQDTTSYTWVDAEGLAHDMDEADELLVKRLPVHP